MQSVKWNMTDSLNLTATFVTNFRLADSSEHGCQPTGSERDQERNEQPSDYQLLINRLQPCGCIIYHQV
jgi:hypothetical protein